MGRWTQSRGLAAASGICGGRGDAIALVLVAIALSATGLGWGLPDRVGWAPDEMVPSIVLDAIEQQFSGGWFYKYPPLQLYLLSVVYGPVLLLARWGAIGDPQVDAGTYAVLFYLTRAVVVAMGAATVWSLYRLGQRVLNDRSAWLGTLLWVLTPVYAYYAKVGNTDMPMLFWLVLSLHAYLNILENHRPRDYALWAALAAAAASTKDLAYGYFVIVFPWLLWHYTRRRDRDGAPRPWWHRVGDRRVVYPIAVGIGVYLLLQTGGTNWLGFFARVREVVGGDASVRPRYDGDLAGQVALHWQTLRQLRFNFGWASWLAICGGLVTYAVRMVHQTRGDRPPHSSAIALPQLLVPAAAYYLSVIVPLQYNPDRFLLPLMPALALFGGYGLDRLLSAGARDRRRWQPLATVLVALILMGGLGHAWSVNSLVLHDGRYRVETWLRDRYRPHTTILAIGIQKYQPRLDRYDVLYQRRPSLDDLVARPADLIVISSGTDERHFQQQDRDRPTERLILALKRHQLPYQLMYRDRGIVPWDWLDRAGMAEGPGGRARLYSNLDKINPEIQIFQRQTPPLPRDRRLHPSP